MKVKQRQKVKIIQFCRKELKDAELKAERDSITKIEAYKKIEKHKYRAIEKTRYEDHEPNYEDDEQDLEQLQKVLYGELLEIEINLQSALTEARNKFISKVNQIIDDQKKLTVDYITAEVTPEVEQFCTKFIEAAFIEKERFDQLMNENPDIDLDDD